MSENTLSDGDNSSEIGDGSLPNVSCTLTAEEAQSREAWLEDNLLPHLTNVAKHDRGYTFVFERSPEVYSSVAEIAWKESQCCSWATFQVELPPGDDPIKWHERSDREEGMALFGDALADLSQRDDAVPQVD